MSGNWGSMAAHFSCARRCQSGRACLGFLGKEQGIYSSAEERVRERARERDCMHGKERELTQGCFPAEISESSRV